jgi:regulator of sirC expression with transglutaminase-like and TPR domain
MSRLSPSTAGRVVPRRFEDLAALPDHAIDVALGAAFIARDAYGGLDVARVLSQIDAIAAPLASEGLARMAAQEQVARLSAHLYGTLGFRGNEKDYYDPRNSLINEVLDRRMGIPITLAIVYCEVAHRLGIPASGVGFPGHFLVRVETPEPTAAPRGAIFIDPFYGGRALDESALTRMAARALGQEGALKPEHLAAASPRAILVRVLTNLKAIYLQRGDQARAHLALDRIVTLAPDSAGALKERGLVAAKLGAAEAAREDLARVLELDPSASDAAAIRAQLAKVTAAAGRSLN